MQVSEQAILQSWHHNGMLLGKPELPLPQVASR